MSGGRRETQASPGAVGARRGAGKAVRSPDSPTRRRTPHVSTQWGGAPGGGQASPHQCLYSSLRTWGSWGRGAPATTVTLVHGNLLESEMGS